MPEDIPLLDASAPRGVVFAPLVHADRPDPFMFESLRTRLEQFLADATPPADRGAEASAIRQSLVEMKAAVMGLRDALAASEQDLAAERRQLEDADRRGRLAQGIGDAETAEVAQRFIERHRERAAVLERKIGVQREELALADREMTELAGRVRSAPQTAANDSVQQAWRELEAAGGARPGTDPNDVLLSAELDRARRNAAVNEQLAYLKKKLGKE
jgi:hypothetical protein